MIPRNIFFEILIKRATYAKISKIDIILGNESCFWRKMAYHFCQNNIRHFRKMMYVIFMNFHQISSIIKWRRLTNMLLFSESFEEGSDFRWSDAEWLHMSFLENDICHLSKWHMSFWQNDISFYECVVNLRHLFCVKMTWSRNHWIYKFWALWNYSWEGSSQIIVFL